MSDILLRFVTAEEALPSSTLGEELSNVMFLIHKVINCADILPSVSVYVFALRSAHAPTPVWLLFYSSAFKTFFLAALGVQSALFYLRGERKSSGVATSQCLLSSSPYF